MSAVICERFTLYNGIYTCDHGTWSSRDAYEKHQRSTFTDHPPGYGTCDVCGKDALYCIDGLNVCHRHAAAAEGGDQP
ncbi:hypothetical protein GS489_22945 [Rhodococcus hoagii]|nr:hypothetical protein [Prescottella equi]